MFVLFIRHLGFKNSLIWCFNTFLWMLLGSTLRTMKSLKRADMSVCGPCTSREPLRPAGHIKRLGLVLTNGQQTKTHDSVPWILMSAMLQLWSQTRTLKAPSVIVTFRSMTSLSAGDTRAAGRKQHNTLKPVRHAESVFTTS